MKRTVVALAAVMVLSFLLFPSPASGQGGAAVPRALAVGDRAPDFALLGSDGRTYKLSDYRGKQVVILAWFARAFSAGWTAECQSLRESGDAIRAFNVVHFAASVDTPEDLRAFADKLGVDYPLLSDSTRKTARAYGVVKDDTSSATRWTFYIGLDGKILYIDRQVSPGNHGKVVADKLAELGVARRGALGRGK